MSLSSFKGFSFARPVKLKNAYVDLSPGTVLHRRYRVMDKLGSGMHSSVWLCRDTSVEAYAYPCTYPRISIDDNAVLQIDRLFVP